MAESRPAALPPAERTVGQLIAESIRLYGTKFWAVVPLGLPFVVVDIAGVGHSVNVQTLLLWAFAPLFCGAYVRASQLVTGGAPTLSALVVALVKASLADIKQGSFVGSRRPVSRYSSRIGCEASLG